MEHETVRLEEYRRRTLKEVVVFSAFVRVVLYCFMYTAVVNSATTVHGL